MGQALFLGFPHGFFLTRPFSELCSFEHYLEMHMARPKNCRYVERKPHVTYFKPRGIPMTELTETLLTVEGLEALRLADLEGLTTGEGAERMRISRHTFGRTLAEARRAVADALVNGTGPAHRRRELTPSSPTQRRRRTRLGTRSFTCRKLPFPAKALRSTIWWTRVSGRAGGFVIVDPRNDGNLLPRQRGLPDYGAGRGH